MFKYIVEYNDFTDYRRELIELVTDKLLDRLEQSVDKWEISDTYFSASNYIMIRYVPTGGKCKIRLSDHTHCNKFNFDTPYIVSVVFSSEQDDPTIDKFDNRNKLRDTRLYKQIRVTDTNPNIDKLVTHILDVAKQAATIDKLEIHKVQATDKVMVDFYNALAKKTLDDDTRIKITHQFDSAILSDVSTKGNIYLSLPFDTKDDTRWFLLEDTIKDSLVAEIDVHDFDFEKSITPEGIFPVLKIGSKCKIKWAVLPQTDKWIRKASAIKNHTVSGKPLPEIAKSTKPKILYESHKEKLTKKPA